MGFFQIVSMVFGYLAGLTGEKNKTTQEGAHYTDGQSFYQVDLTSQGQLVNSAAFLMPTKEDAAPRSALPGTSPLTITNGSVEVTYAMGMSGADGAQLAARRSGRRSPMATSSGRPSAPAGCAVR